MESSASGAPGPPSQEAPQSGAGAGPVAIAEPSGAPAPPSRYESQKRRDWNTFLQYLKNHKPPLTLARCSGAHVIEFLKYLDQFGKTKVHVTGCDYFGNPNQPAPCSCPLKQAWGSLDALIGRLRAAYEENGGRPESNPFGARAVRIYLREVREGQAKARGIPYEKKKRKRVALGGGNGGAAGASGSGVGLSAKIYTAMVDAFYHGAPSTNSRAYLLLNSVVPMGVSIVTAPLMREPKTGGSTYMAGGFVVMFFVTIVTGVYAVMGTVGPLSKLVPPRVHAVGLGILLAAPLAIPVSAMVVDFVKGRFQIKREMRVHSFSMEEDGVGERVANEAKEEGVLEKEVVGVEEQMGVRMMVRRVEFWLYFFVYMFGATLGLVFLNNLGQIAESRGLSKSSSLVSLSSSFGFFGRLMPSLMDYFLAKSRYAVSSTACIATLMAPMTGAFFMLLNTTTISLYISTAVIGVCTGAITSIAVSTTSELFGTKNFSVNHNIIVANIPIGSFLFGYFAAILYQKEGDDRNGRCMGADCYSKTFLIWGSICFLGTLLSFILFLRIRKTQLERG